MKKSIKHTIALLIIISFVLSVFCIPASALSPVTKPKAPSELTAEAWQFLFTEWRVNLDWQDNSLNESGFKIYRKTAGSSSFTLLDTVAADTVAYTDTTVAADKTYYYYVTAYNAAGGNNSDSVTVAVTDTLPDAATDLFVTPNPATDPTEITFTWQDNSDNESGFMIYKRDWFGSTSYALLDTTLANVESYTDSDIESEGAAYLYRVVAYNDIGETVSSPDSKSLSLPLKAPTDFMGIADGTDINLTWTDNSEKEDAYWIFRSEDGVSYIEIDTISADSTSYTDSGLDENTVYYYSLSAYFLPDIQYNSDEAFYAVLTGEEEEEATILRFYIDSTSYRNGSDTLTMDTAPIIINSRTLLPIRYVSEPLGADLDWDAEEQMVTITMGTKEIKLWIGSNTAEVDGVDTLIDSSNEDVTPIIVDPGRTMLPLRFIAENLGCDVEWDPILSEVMITYTP